MLFWPRCSLFGFAVSDVEMYSHWVFCWLSAAPDSVLWFIWQVFNTPIITLFQWNLTPDIFSWWFFTHCFWRRKKTSVILSDISSSFLLFIKSCKVDPIHADAKSLSCWWCKVTDKYSLNSSLWHISKETLNCLILEGSLVWWWMVELNEC